MTDPDDTPDIADTAAPRAAGTGAPRAASAKNEQFAALNRLRRERTWVDVYLIGGTCLHGQIRSFDASMMLLATRSGDIALYHHAISTVVRGQKRGGSAKARRKAVQEVRGIVQPRSPMRAPARIAPVDRGLPRDDEPDDPDVEPAAPVRRAPVVIVKQRKLRSYVKPDS